VHFVLVHAMILLVLDWLVIVSRLSELALNRDGGLNETKCIADDIRGKVQYIANVNNGL
jgi:hypothetical protein